MIKTLTVLLLVFPLSVICFAFDMTFVSLDTALKSGNLVLIGVVDSTSITDKKAGAIKASAKILIEKCLVGNSCEKNKFISLDYFTKISIGTMLPIKLSVGDQILLVLKYEVKKGKTTYEFDSDINGGTDFCFECNAFPYSIIDINSPFKCRDLMTGKEFNNLTFDKIEAIIIKE